MTPEENLKLYEQDTNAERNIRDSITNSYNALKPELEQVRRFENEQMPTFYDTFSGYGAGTGPTDLSPTTLLQNATRNVANMATTGQVARDAFDVRRTSMEDLISQGLNQWQQGYSGAQNSYDRWFQMMQFEEQKRQFDAQLAKMGGSGSATPVYNFGDFGNPDVEQENPDYTKAYYDYLRDKNVAYNAPAELARTAQTKVSGYSNPMEVNQPATTSSSQLNKYIDKLKLVGL